MKDREAFAASENPGKFKKLNLNSGPGTYAQEKVKVVTTVKDMMSNAFVTKVRIYQINPITGAEILSNSARIQCV